MVLDFLDYAYKYPNKIVGRTSCALLSQVSCHSDSLTQRIRLYCIFLIEMFLLCFLSINVGQYYLKYAINLVSNLF